MEDFEIDSLDQERQFAQASGRIFSAACQKVLAAGDSVLFSRGDTLYSLHADGRREAIDKIEPPYPAKRGARFKLR